MCGERGIPILPTYFLHVLAALLSLVILPTPEEPLPQPTGSLAIHSLEAQSMRCLQPFHTLDTRDRPFHTQAQEILDILLRHPSGKATLLRTWGVFLLIKMDADLGIGALSWSH